MKKEKNYKTVVLDTHDYLYPWEVPNFDDIIQKEIDEGWIPLGSAERHRYDYINSCGIGEPNIRISQTMYKPKENK